MPLSSRVGVLLINLGTPKLPEPNAVRKYLREFLTDPRVVELPFLLRQALVNLIIIPKRLKQTTAAYSSIWSANGSPLLYNSILIKNALQKYLGENYIVRLGMRYGLPSIDLAIEQLLDAEIDKLVILPLFPQYASATSGSAIEYVLNILGKQRVIIPFSVINDFHNTTGYISALRQSIKPYINDKSQFVLFSFHGLPLRQIYGLGKNCYREKCLTTATLTARQLNLSEDSWTLSFQSRLGRLEWIKPYTDDVLNNLRAKGVKRLLVVCPSFIADCLETLEEIGVRAKERWGELGGEQFTLIPCLNDSAVFIENLLQMTVNASSYQS